MDSRFANNSIFSRRKIEWNKEKVQRDIENIFKSIEIIDGWKFKSCELLETKKQNRSEELKRNIIYSLKITVEDSNQKEYHYNIQVPELINDQFFYIGGYLKIPIFQLLDLPIIFRKIKKDKIIKFKSNSITIQSFFTSEDVLIKLFGYKIPVEVILASLHTEQEIEDFFENKKNPLLKKVYAKTNDLLDKYNESELIEILGSYYAENNKNINKEKKGNSVIFSLKAAYRCDVFTQKFMKTNSFILEILNAIEQGERSDTDLKNKRIRFAEYILSPLVKKMHELLCSMNVNKKAKFQIPQTIIIDNCNISDVVHFNFPINPAGEVSNFLQASLTGPGGFKKDSVPSYLRNMDESHYGRICPADTPDRDGCGVILNLVPTVNLDENGVFLGESEIITSYPITLTPFCKNDDQTRLQMASNQTKQAIFIKDATAPIIKSGTENLYLEYTTFLHRAKDSGKVVHIDEKYMIVLYDNGDSEVFNIGFRGLYLNTIDFIEPLFEIQDKFKKDDVLCRSKSINEDNEIALGQNLLSAVCIWKGYNYEDGIIIRESVAKKLFTSVHSVDLSFEIESGQVLLSLLNEEYNPLPKVGDVLLKGQTYAKIKNINGEDGFETINMEPEELTSPVNCRITSIEIYPNNWNKKIFEFDNFIKENITTQTENYKALIKNLKEYMNKDNEIEKFTVLNNINKLNCETLQRKYKEKGRKIGGVKFKINAVYESPIEVGDKLSNRHGAKGICSLIIPDDQAPVLEDGRKIDIIINPLGIISRMNVGQLYELSLTEALYQYISKIKNEFQDKKLTKSVKNKIINKIKEFIEKTDKTETKWPSKKVMDKFEYQLNNYDLDTALGDLSIICPQFQDINNEELDELMKLSGAKYEQKIYDPIQKIWITNPVSIGYVYFLKLVHRSSEKLSARSIGPYSKNTLQPVSSGNKKRGRAHKFGEMEVWALQAHGAKNLLKDLMTVHSDSSGKKNKLLAEIINNPELADEDLDETPQSIRLFESYMAAMGLKIN